MGDPCCVSCVRMLKKEWFILLAGILLWCKLALVTQSTFRYTTSLMQKNQVPAVTEGLSSCCNDGCNGVKDGSYLCNCCPGLFQARQENTVDEKPSATQSDNSKNVDHVVRKANHPLSGASTHAVSSCCQPSCEGSNSGGYNCACCHGNHARNDKEQPHEEMIPAERQAVSESVEASSSCCHPSCEGSNSGSYNCMCCHGNRAHNIKKQHHEKEKPEAVEAAASSCCHPSCEGSNSGSYNCMCCHGVGARHVKEQHHEEVKTAAAQPVEAASSSCCHPSCEGTNSGSYNCMCCHGNRARSGNAQQQEEEEAEPQDQSQAIGQVDMRFQGKLPQGPDAAAAQRKQDIVPAQHSVKQYGQAPAHSQRRQTSAQAQQPSVQAEQTQVPADKVAAASASQSQAASQSPAHVNEVDIRPSDTSGGDKGQAQHDAEWEAVDQADRKAFDAAMGTNAVFHDYISPRHISPVSQGDAASVKDAGSAQQATDTPWRMPGEFEGTNVVFQNTHNDGGVLRARRRGRVHVTPAIQGMLASAEAQGMLDEAPTSNSTQAAQERRPLSWDKSWWEGKAWFLWALSGPTLTLLIFILNSMTQGWQCGLIYAAILIPLDVLTYYFDLYAYDNGELYWIELTLALALNCCLCICMIPAFAVSRMYAEEGRGPGGSWYDPYAAPGTYGAMGTGGGFTAFTGAGEPTGYGYRTEKTQLV